MTRAAGTGTALQHPRGRHSRPCSPAIWRHLAAASLAALLFPCAVFATDVSVARGPAFVVDATHLEVAGRQFKLYGVDGPDIDETCDDAQGKEYPCGIDARTALADLIKGGSVSCLPRGPNENAELLGVCSSGTTDLAEAMIEAGWAIADRPRTLYYEKAEEQARLTKHGLWQGRFVPPGDWRIGERVPQSHVGKGNNSEKLF
ncbi:MAG TPA: thermonuclease family protein [Alphaproteobacteria bacterium]|nr:thermonuclease family protein [Alphaproteobacteria bacterium]